MWSQFLSLNDDDSVQSGCRGRKSSEEKLLFSLDVKEVKRGIKLELEGEGESVVTKRNRKGICASRCLGEGISNPTLSSSPGSDRKFRLHEKEWASAGKDRI